MLETLAMVLDALDGMAGFAALLNGLLLWPIVKTLKGDHVASKQAQDARLDDHEERLDDHEVRVARLEA